MNREEFIITAINDTQSSIRAMDVKIGAMLTAVLLPASGIGKIWIHITELFRILPYWLNYPLFLTFFLSWVLSILVLGKALSSINNPSKLIKNKKKVKGSFYGSKEFQFNAFDAIWNRTNSNSKVDLNSFSEKYPDTDKSISDELSFEHLKLIYIRNLKSCRLTFAFMTTLIWFISGGIIYLLSKILN